MAGWGAGQVRSATSIEWFTLSSLFYASIPVIVIMYGSAAVPLAIATTAITAGVSMVVALWRRDIIKTLKDAELFLLSIVNKVFFFLFILFTGISYDNSAPIYTLVIIESWPLVAAFIVPLFLGSGVTKIDGESLVIGFFAFLGVLLVASPAFASFSFDIGANIDIRSVLGLISPIFAMIFMVLASSVKARHAKIAFRRYGVNPADAYFGSFVAASPMILVFIAVFHFFDFEVFTVGDVTFAALAVSLFNIASSIFFSFGTNKLKNSSDLFIWFFAPVFSVILFCLYEQRVPSDAESIGVSIIVSCNLLISLRADVRYSYSFTVISIMVMGVVCIFPPIDSLPEYYDAVAVLSIFISVTLAFLLGRLSQRADREIQLFGRAISLAKGALDEPDFREFHRRATLLNNARGYVPIKRCYNNVSHLTDREEVLYPLRELSISKLRGIGFAHIFSSSLSIFALFVLISVARPSGWHHDLIAVLFFPSVMYAFLSAIDLNNNRYSNFVGLSKGLSIAAPSRLLISDRRVRSGARNTYWSSFLLVFLLTNILISLAT